MRAQRIKASFCRTGMVLAVVLASLSACQSGERELPVNRASALVNGTIHVGMSRADVVAWLGEPYRIETNGSMEFLFYRAPWMMNWGTIGSNPIAIVDGKVAGAGSSFYSNNRAQNSN
jgi:hypothetical protein